MSILYVGDSTTIIQSLPKEVCLTFLDPPFNQGKDYEGHNDRMDETDYWNWMSHLCHDIRQRTVRGGVIYFMHREKRTNELLSCLWRAGWYLQNLIIWKKKASAVPMSHNYGLAYQVIAYATTHPEKPRVFNKLRIDPPLLVTEKYSRPNGMFVTNVWDDIRELTSGYFAGNEPLKTEQGERAHKQQAPIDLLLRILLTSSSPGDLILDPFAGTGTTLVVAEQLQRKSIGIEINPTNCDLINERRKAKREVDNTTYRYEQYKYTENLPVIWGSGSENALRQLELFKEGG